MSGAGQLLAVALVGVATGVLSGMFGVGGAIISTPAVRALGTSPLEAVGSTLPSVIPSAISGTYRYARARLIRWEVFAWTASVGVVASVVGALLTAVTPGDGHPLMLATAVLVAFTAVRLGRPVPPVEVLDDATANVRAGADDRTGERCAPLPDPARPGNPQRPGADRATPARCMVVGVAAGGLSGLLGIGGGLLMVPAFVAWLRLPLKAALGTSLACVGVLAVPGTVTHAVLGNIDWAYAIPLGVGVVPGAQLGSHLAIRSPERLLRLIVASVLGAVAIAYFTAELLELVRG